MNRDIQEVSNDLSTLTDDARTLMTATADMAEEKVGQARQRLAAALESGKELYGRVHDRAIAGAKNADHAVREKPYQAIAIGLGLGALLGYLVSRRFKGSRR